MRVISCSLLFLVMLFQPLHAVSALQTPPAIEFREYEVINGFPQSLTFRIEICNVPENNLVYLNYQIGQASWSTSINNAVSSGLTEDGCQRLRTSVITKDEPPMVDVRYYWLVKVRGGQTRSPQQEYVYEDPSFDWQTLQDQDLRLYWHDRPEEFGKKLFDIAHRSIEQQRGLYGIDLQFPAQIVIENTDEEFMSWQANPDPDTGGLALPWHGMTIQLVEDTSEDWLQEVLPHEISHLYFYQVTLHSDVWPPLWLDEGLAVYYEYGDHQYEDDLVRSAVLEDRVIPLSSLREEFGSEDRDVDLAYAQSYYVAVYILEAHGKEKLSLLLKEYDLGKDHDEAFMSAFHQSLDEFEADWETWIRSKFEIVVPATLTPAPQALQGQETPAPFPGRRALGIIVLLCCLSSLGATGLGLVVFLLQSRAKKTTETHS